MSLEYYRRLVELCPENRRYSLSYIQVEIKHYSFEKDSYMLEDNNTEAKELEEAVQRLYKLNFLDDPQ